MNLLSGQTVFLTAVVTEPMRYIAVEREVLKQLLFEDGSLSDLLLSAFVERRELLQQRQGVGFEIIGAARLARHAPAGRVRPTRSGSPTPGSTPRENLEAAAAGRGARAPSSCRWCGCPAASSCERPSNGELSRALGIGLELAPSARRSTC